MNPSSTSRPVPISPVFNTRFGAARDSKNGSASASASAEVSPQTSANIAIGIANNSATLKLADGLAQLRSMAVSGDKDAVDMLMQLSTHTDVSIATSAQKTVLALTTDFDVDPNVKSTISALALDLYQFQSNAAVHEKFKPKPILTGILFLAGTQANRNGDQLIAAEIEKKLALRNPQCQIEDAVDENILNPGRLIPIHEIVSSTNKLQHLENMEHSFALNAEAEDRFKNQASHNEAQIKSISHQLLQMIPSPSGHRVLAARICENNHYITALFSLGIDNKINCDCLDTHSQSIPNAQVLLEEKLSHAFGAALGEISFTRNDDLQRNNACGVINVLLLQQLNAQLSIPWPDPALQPASPPQSAKPSVKNMLDDFSAKLGSLTDLQKDSVFNGLRADMIADWQITNGHDGQANS